MSVLSPLAPPPSSSGHSRSWSQAQHSHASAELQGRAVHTGSIVQTRKPGDGDGCRRAEVGRAAFLALGSWGKGTRVPHRRPSGWRAWLGRGLSWAFSPQMGVSGDHQTLKLGKNRIHLAFLFSYYKHMTAFPNLFRKLLSPFPQRGLGVMIFV